MKGQTDLLTFLMKIISTAWIVVVIIGVIFSLMNYDVILIESGIERELLIVGDSLLAAECISVESNGYPVKGLLDWNKLDTIGEGNEIDCFDYKRGYYVEIYNSTKAVINFGSPITVIGARTSTFPAAIMYSDDNVKPVLVDITMG